MALGLANILYLSQLQIYIPVIQAIIIKLYERSSCTSKSC